MLKAFLYGVVLAFGLIMPLGIQNVFLFNQGATQRHFLRALPSVITASICDSLLITIAVLGVSVAVLTLPWLKAIIFGVGFFFLMYMGAMTWRRAASTLSAKAEPLSPKRQIAFALSVSLLNPHALLDSISVIGTNSLNFYGKARFAYTLACILVSCTWFFGLSMAGHWLQKTDKSGLGLKFINKVAALIIWSVALYIGWQLMILIKLTLF